MKLNNNTIIVILTILLVPVFHVFSFSPKIIEVKHIENFLKKIRDKEVDKIIESAN